MTVSYSPYQIKQKGFMPRLYTKADIERERIAIYQCVDAGFYDWMNRYRRNFEFMQRQINQQMMENHGT